MSVGIGGFIHEKLSEEIIGATFEFQVRKTEKEMRCTVDTTFLNAHYPRPSVVRNSHSKQLLRNYEFTNFSNV